MKLAILIPTIVGREKYLERLMDILNPQIEKYKDDVVVITLKDNKEKSIGEKRNELMRMAVEMGCSHRCYCDDDDTVSDNYLDLNMPGVYGNYDCNSLVGIYSVNGEINKKKHLFIHSLKYNKWFEDDTYYYRTINHLNVTKLDLVKDFPFPDSNFGEDGTNAMQIQEAGVLKTEYEITVPFYHYLFRTKHNGI